MRVRVQVRVQVQELGQERQEPGQEQVLVQERQEPVRVQGQEQERQEPERQGNLSEFPTGCQPGWRRSGQQRRRPERQARPCFLIF